MERYFIFDKFNTWYDWGFILTAKDIPDAEPNENYVELDGADGSIDLSEALTGHITYKDRTISASFWTNEGTYSDREKLIRDIVRDLHGRKIKIVEPDDSQHYFYGRLKLKKKINIIPYATLDFEAVCDPWRYCMNETTRRVDVSGNSIDTVITNNGAKILTPSITISGDITITYGDTVLSLSDGTYKITGFELQRGVNIISVSGDGYAEFRYREGDL